MMMTRKRMGGWWRSLSMGAALIAVCAAAAVPGSAPVLANDSQAEVALGGLTLMANDDISMDSEELFLPEHEVRVDYVYTNNAYEDREVTIAFPLPAFPEEPGDFEYTYYPGWDDKEYFDFSTRVNGEPVEYTVEDRATIDGRDVTAQVLAKGLPVHWYADSAFTDSLGDMSEERKRELTEAGLLGIADPEFPRLLPTWKGQRFVMRTQTFPARQSVTVSHRYRPLIGGSAGGGLEPGIRNDPEYGGGTDYYTKRYCVDGPILAGVDKRLARGEGDTSTYMTETWLGYVLSSGANWRGPIKHFRLVVDKGSPDNLVSFCMDGATKISQTRFEVVKTDFEPKGDLNVLILKFVKLED